MATFERFTDRARRVLVLAQEEARLLGHGFIGTEHILLGIMREGDGVGARALQELELTPEAVRTLVEETIGLSSSRVAEAPPFTPRAKKVMELALKEALQLGHNYIGTEHLLLGIVREGEGVGAQVLLRLGVDLTAVRQTVVKLLAGYPVGEESHGVRTSGWVVRASGEPHLVMCSFCGRRPPDAGRLVASGPAVICEHCIKDWSERLATSDEEPGTILKARIIEPERQEPKDDE